LRPREPGIEIREYPEKTRAKREADAKRLRTNAFNGRRRVIGSDPAVGSGERFR
jgi:hypothetical protein